MNGLPRGVLRLLVFGGMMTAMVCGATAEICDAVFGRVHVFTHTTLHPLVFGCWCEIEHPLQEKGHTRR